MCTPILCMRVFQMLSARLLRAMEKSEQLLSFLLILF
jgi:hypothetical protein